MALDRDQLDRWLRGHEVANRHQRELLTHQDPRPSWSIAISLSMIAAAEHSGVVGRRDDAVIAEGDAEVLETWRRLRERW